MESGVFASLSDLGATAAYSGAGVVESHTRAETIPRAGGEFAAELFGAALGGMVGGVDFEYSPGSSNQIVSVFGSPYIMKNDTIYSGTYKNKQEEKRSSDEPGSPPYRGDELPSDGSVKPAEGFEWKGKGKPGSKEGSWVKGGGKTKEILFPDLQHGPPKGKHWDYVGPGFENGTRLFPDGTWEVKR